jgi:hypothetical protein
VTTLKDAVLQLSGDVEERAQAHSLPYDVDISQAKYNSSEAPVGTTVNGRYEIGETSATASAHAHLPKTNS